MGQLTDRTAAGLLLRALLSDKATEETRALVINGLEPGDMFQLEYMMILAAAQRLHQEGRPINVAGLESELESEDPAGIARMVLHSVHETRNAGPTDKEGIRELVEFLVGFRDRR